MVYLSLERDTLTLYQLIEHLPEAFLSDMFGTAFGRQLQSSQTQGVFAAQFQKWTNFTIIMVQQKHNYIMYRC